jgi:hypothetical protein
MIQDIHVLINPFEFYNYVISNPLRWRKTPEENKKAILNENIMEKNDTRNSLTTFERSGLEVRYAL